MFRIITGMLLGGLLRGLMRGQHDARLRRGARGISGAMERVLSGEGASMAKPPDQASRGRNGRG